MKVITHVVLDLGRDDASLLPVTPLALPRVESELVLATLLAAEYLRNAGVPVPRSFPNR